MYSPKIDEKLIPLLYKLRIQLKKPMTKIVNEMIRESLPRYEIDGRHMERNIRNNRNSSNGEQKVLCPVCLKLHPLEKMRDIEVKGRKKKHLLAICDECFEKHVRPKLEKRNDKDFPF